jgi:transcriptional regulator with XRE-family HTH domain
VATSSDAFSAILRINLPRFRAEAGFSLTEAARAADIDDQALRRYERGGSRMPALVLKLLAELYGRATDDFFDENPPPPRKPVHRPAYYVKRADGRTLNPDDPADLEVLQAIAASSRRYFGAHPEPEATEPERGRGHAREASKKPRHK